jgi:hypothetical protein
MKRAPTRRGAILLAGDLVCFLVFALLGLRSHEDGITLGGIVRAATPFQAGWLIAGLVPALRESHATHRRNAVAKRWVPAWLIGLTLRTLLLDRSFEVSFAIVSFIANGALLLVWRSVLARLLLREPSRSE